MEGEKIYKRLMQLYKELPGKFNVLQESIDIKVQWEYFECSGKIKKEKKNER